MNIKKTRIRNVWNYLDLFEDNEEFYISISDLETHKKRLVQIGFTAGLSVGEQVLPRPVGSISYYNAEGKNIVRKDLRMETVSRQVYWTWQDWGENEHSKIVDVPYKRYPREFIEPPSEELQIAEKDGMKLLLSRSLIKVKSNEEDIKHLINLYLEIFGECDLLKKDLVPPVKPSIIRLNWDILPPGKYPWDKVKVTIQNIIKEQPGGNQPVIRYRIRTITKFNPDFMAIGRGGFNNYMVFGFKDKNIFVLESAREGNATYIFSNNWEELSKLTKREILSEELQEDRIIHKRGWANKIKKLLQ